MRLIPYDMIEVPHDRIRREFPTAALDELACSIIDNGLFHPLLLRDDGITLIAGERRFRVIGELFRRNVSFRYDGSEVPIGMVPVSLLADTTELKALEAELHENIRRTELTWQERSLSIAKLHHLRKAQDPKHTIKKTAAEVSSGPGAGSPTYTQEDLIISEFLDDPDVSKAKTRSDALRVVERKVQRSHQESLAREFGLKVISDTNQLHHGDMRKILPNMDPETVDCIIADPPYGISADTFDNQSAVLHGYEDSIYYSDEIYTFLASEGFRIGKAEAHIYVFCDVRRFSLISTFFTQFGWNVWNWPLIWWRGSSIGIAPRPSHGPRRTYEGILFANKGSRRTNILLPDVLYYAHEYSVERGAHKPYDLYADLMRRSCLPGDTVLDPCCGTGPIFPAALMCSVRAIGVERDAAAYALAAERLYGDPNDSPPAEGS